MMWQTAGNFTVHTKVILQAGHAHSGRLIRTALQLRTSIPDQQGGASAQYRHLRRRAGWLTSDLWPWSLRYLTQSLLQTGGVEICMIRGEQETARVWHTWMGILVTLCTRQRSQPNTQGETEFIAVDDVAHCYSFSALCSVLLLLSITKCIKKNSGDWKSWNKSKYKYSIIKKKKLCQLPKMNPKIRFCWEKCFARLKKVSVILIYKNLHPSLEWK